MKKFTILIILSFLAIGNLLAQSDFRSGYVLTQENDTLYGLIDYRGSLLNSKKCTYKKDEKAEKQEFGPNEITGYQFIDGKFYISEVFKEEPVFLEYLLNGIVKVYFYRDNHGDYYLIKAEDDQLYELKDEDEEVFINDVRYVKASKDYIGKLKYVFKNSRKISNRAERIKLDHKSLIEISQDYHEEVCTDEQECIIYEKKLPKNRAKIGPLLGVHALSVWDDPSVLAIYGNIFLANNQFGLNVAPSLGFFVKKGMLDLNERLFFQYEAVFYQMKLYGINTYDDPIYNLEILNEVEATRNTISQTALIRYEIHRGSWAPTLVLGGTLNYYFGDTFIRKAEIRNNSGEFLDAGNSTYNPFRVLEQGLTVGLGLVKVRDNGKDAFIDLRYQRGFGMLPGINTNVFLMKLGYQL